MALVDERDARLALEPKSSPTHLEREALLVCRLEQARTKLLVHLDAGAEDRVGQRAESRVVHAPLSTPLAFAFRERTLLELLASSSLG